MSLPEIPGYTLLEKIGEGGMGVVYRALDVRTGREVAMKLLAPGGDSEVSTRRFRREFRAASRLRHPHVAAVFDMHAEPPLHYTMELVRGAKLDSVLGADGTELNDAERVARVRALVGQVLVALDAVHAAELVHRDLKPENVLVTELGPGDELGFEPPSYARRFYEPIAGARPFVKLLDFGLAWVSDQSQDLTKSGIIVGTVDYISPEQVLGSDVDSRADLYSVGVVLFELLTGRPPFEARDAVSLLLKHAYEAPPAPGLLNPGVDPDLEAIALRLLAKEPADRFPSARETLRALAADKLSEDVRRSTTSIRIVSGRQNLFPPRLVGREDGLRAARARVSAVKEEGKGGVLVVAGEAGIGKTRLLEEVKKAARMQGLAVYAGAAHEEQGYAFAPLLPVLDTFARDAERLPRDPALVDAARVLGRIVPGWRTLLGEDGGDGPVLGADEERFRVLAAAAEVVRRLAGTRGLLLVVEDVHWSDPSSLELLSYLVRNLSETGTPLLLGLSVREEEVEPGSSIARWRDALRRSPVVEETALGRLDAGAIAAMARSMLGSEMVPEEVTRWLASESQGVPFLVVEMLAALSASGGLVAGPGGGLDLVRRVSGEVALPQALPPSVAEIVRCRLDKLGERERKVVAAAALVGPEVPFDLLQAAAAVDENELLDALQVLLNRRILIESREERDLFLFASKVMRDVLIEETFERRRRKAHERIAGALEARARRRPEDVVALAQHWLAAGNHDLGLVNLVESVRFHRQRLDHEPALQCARRALGILEDRRGAAPADTTRLELLRETGEIETALCKYERAADAFATLATAAAAAGRPHLHAQALLGRADVDLRRGEYGDAEARTREALEVLAASGADAGGAAPSGAILERAHTALGRIAWHLGRPGEALDAFSAALAAARDTGDEVRQATALNNIGYAHFARGEFAPAQCHFEQAVALFRRRDHALGVARGLEAMASVAQRRAAYAQGAAALHESRALMHRLGDRRGEAYCVVSEGNIHAYRASWLEALALYDRAEATFVELGEMRGVAFCASNRGRVLTSLGAFGEALAALARALKLARKIEEKGEVAFCLYALAEVSRELADFDEAARHDAVAIGLFREQGERYGLGLALAGSAATALGRGDRAGAARCAGEALEVASEAGGMPEVEVRAAAARAAAVGSADEAAAAAELAASLDLVDLRAAALVLEADLATDGARAAAARAVARDLVQSLAAPLEEFREGFLRRRAFRSTLAPAGPAGPLCVG